MFNVITHELPIIVVAYRSEAKIRIRLVCIFYTSEGNLRSQWHSTLHKETSYFADVRPKTRQREKACTSQSRLCDIFPEFSHLFDAFSDSEVQIDIETRNSICRKRKKGGNLEM